MKDLTWESRLAVEDATGYVRVRLGELAGADAGDYGLQVTDPTTGVSTQFLPLYEAGIVTQINPGATAAYTSTAGPVVTAVIGASGQALLTANSLIGLPGVAANQSGGFVGISVDGAAPTGPLTQLLYFSTGSTPSAAVPLAANQSAQVVVSGLSAGKHSFRMEYQTVGPSVIFRERFLQVRPL